MVELHLPVMEKEVLHYLGLEDEGIYVDATVGDGGHAEAICRTLGPEGKLIGIDWDRKALKRATERLKGFSEKIRLEHGSYTQLEEILQKLSIDKVNGILIDLGASTLQLMDAERGFSFHRDGALDMRMDQGSDLSAEEIVNEYTAEELAAIIFRYGEERWAKRIAARIVQAREKKGPITRSSELAEIVKEAIPARYRRTGGHPSRKTFQALRLAVNRELENIEQFLPQAVRSLRPQGRLCVIAYHSLEDRIVKRFYRDLKRTCSCPPQLPCICSGTAALKVLTPKAVRPGAVEVEKNPRARSALLRVAERTESQWLKAGD